jgi:hypothetical protein
MAGHKRVVGGPFGDDLAEIGDFLDGIQREIQAAAYRRACALAELRVRPSQTEVAKLLQRAAWDAVPSSCVRVGMGSTRLGVSLRHPTAGLFVAKLTWNYMSERAGFTLGAWKATYEAALWLGIDTDRLKLVCPMLAITRERCLLMRQGEAYGEPWSPHQKDDEFFAPMPLHPMWQRWAKVGLITDESAEFNRMVATISGLRKKLGDSRSIADPLRKERLNNFAVYEGNVVALEPRAHDFYDFTVAFEWLDNELASAHLSLDRDTAGARLREWLEREGRSLDGPCDPWWLGEDEAVPNALSPPQWMELMSESPPASRSRTR